MRARTVSAPRAGPFARAGGILRHDPETCAAALREGHAQPKARTAARLQTPGGDTLTWEMVRPECGRRPIEKARGRFPGAGS